MKVRRCYFLCCPNHKSTSFMKKALKVIGYIFLGFIVLGVIGKLAGVDSDKPVAATSPSETATTPEETPKEEQPTKENTVKAADLVGLYIQNEVKADNDLKGKTFFVSGRIESIGKDLMDNAYITLDSGDPVRTVQCTIDDKAAVAELSKGQKVIVKGECSGLMMNVQMKDCILVSK